MAALEVIALDTSVPQLMAPQAGDTYTFPRAVEMPLGTANGVLYLNGSKVVTSGSALQFSGTALTVNLDGTSLVVGTGGAPTTAASFRSTTRNQLRFPSGASFEWHEGVNELMRLNSTGLGIGTASPSAPLQFGKAVYGAPSDENFYRIKFSDAGGTANDAGIGQPAAGAMGFNVSDSTGYYQWNRGSAGELMRLDLSGNLGLGVTPGAWFSTRKALQIGQSGVLAGSTNSQVLDLVSNAIVNSAGNTVYLVNGFASYYRQFDSVHTWAIAASGTAGAATSFTQAMTLNASGNLLVGTTSGPAGQRLRIAGGDVGLEGQYLYMVDANANIQLGATQNSIISNTDSTNTLSISRTGASSIITFSTAGSERARIPAAGGMVVGTAALATTATDGFLYVPTCAGTPTGTPTTYTGRAPIVVDTTNNKLYFYSGGQWRDAGP